MSIIVEVKKLAYGGDGIAALPSGKTVFVAGGIPGDKVEIETVSEHPKYDNAKIVSICEPSPNRVNEQCPYAGICGGCGWQAMDYETQLKWKQQFILDSLGHIGKIESVESLVRDIMPSARQWKYRNKIELVPTFESGKMKLGYHAQQSDEIVPIDSCMLLSKSHASDPKSIAGALRYLKADSYDLKRVGIRASSRTGSTQIALWTAPGQFPRKAAADVLGDAARVTSVVRVLIRDDVKSRQIRGVETLSGDDYWQEKLGNNILTVSAPSFFQVNTAGAEKLVALAMDGLNVGGNDVACDLYCGVGTFTLPLAERAAEVFAVESVSSSVNDLRRNLFDNDLDGEVIGGDAVRESRGIGKVDKLVVDPPYSGMGQDIFEGISAMKPSTIALVSCNPTTLARDLTGMQEAGYEIESVTPVDMFPQTFHVETVTILHKVKGDNKPHKAAKPKRENSGGSRKGRNDRKGSGEGKLGNGRAQDRGSSNRSSNRQGGKDGGRNFRKDEQRENRGRDDRSSAKQRTDDEKQRSGNGRGQGQGRNGRSQNQNRDKHYDRGSKQGGPSRNGNRGNREHGRSYSSHNHDGNRQYRSDSQGHGANRGNGNQSRGNNQHRGEHRGGNQNRSGSQRRGGGYSRGGNQNRGNGQRRRGNKK